MVPEGQGVGLQGPTGSKTRPTGSQRAKWKTYRVPAGEVVGLKGPRGSRGKPTRSQGVKG